MATITGTASQANPMQVDAARDVPSWPLKITADDTTLAVNARQGGHSLATVPRVESARGYGQQLARPTVRVDKVCRITTPPLYPAQATALLAVLRTSGHLKVSGYLVDGTRWASVTGSPQVDQDDASEMQTISFELALQSAATHPAYDIVGLVRTVAGRVVSDDFDRANSSDIGANFTEAAGDWEILDGWLSSDANSTNGQTAVDAGDETGEMFIQVTLRPDNFFDLALPGVFARYSSSGGHQGYLLHRAPSAWELYRYLNGSSSLLDSDTDTGTFQDSEQARIQLYVADGVQEAFCQENITTGVEDHDSTVGYKLSASNTDHDDEDDRTAALRKGWSSAGSSAATSCLFDDYDRFRSKYVRVSNLESGWKAKVLDGSDVVVSEATESGGTAAIPLGLFDDIGWIPAAGYPTLIVTDGDDVELARYDATGVDPGDRYTALVVKT